jgi:hypothetical protein
MKLKLNVLFVVLGMMLLSNASAHGLNPERHAITYEGGARFGDRVLGYFQARYLSHSTGIPFIYRPFPYSEYVNIAFEARPYFPFAVRYRFIFHIRSAQTLSEFFCKIRDPNTPLTLFILEYAPADLGEWDVDLTKS